MVYSQGTPKDKFLDINLSDHAHLHNNHDNKQE